jgi:hypothetical protein
VGTVSIPDPGIVKTLQPREGFNEMVFIAVFSTMPFLRVESDWKRV